MKAPHSYARYKDTKGYTLVELIIVISIMTTMIGLIGLGISVMFSRDAERVARTIDDQIAEVRTAAMSKPGSYSIIINTAATGSGNYIEVENTALELVKPTVSPASPTPTPEPPSPTKTRIDLDKDAYIVFGKQGSLPASAVDGSIFITFDKANGSVKKIVGTDGTTYENADLNYVFEISCTAVRNTSKNKKVLLMPVTGRHYIE